MIVIGSGPGIGSTTATTFATKGFKHIILMSRNADRLKQDAQEVKAASNAAQVETVPVDLGADESQINASFKKAKSILENWGVPVEVVLFNAIRVGQSKVMEFSSADFERDLKVIPSTHMRFSTTHSSRLVSCPCTHRYSGQSPNSYRPPKTAPKKLPS